MRSPEELFLEAINAYKAWVNTGKDFLNHADLFDIWDDAVTAYAQSVFLDRNRAVHQVLQGLEITR
jgi:recombinational DNA repair ATPase RecF